MSQQGGRPTGHEDDWWGQLYDSTGDTGPTPAPDTLDDRFASAAGAVEDEGGGDGGASRRATAGVPAPRGPERRVSERRFPERRVPEPTDVPPGTGVERAASESPSDPVQGPVAFPPGPTPPGFDERAPSDPPPSLSGPRTSTETPPVTNVPASRRPPDAPSPPTTAPPPPAAPPRPATPPPPPGDGGWGGVGASAQGGGRFASEDQGDGVSGGGSGGEGSRDEGGAAPGDDRIGRSNPGDFGDVDPSAGAELREGAAGGTRETSVQAGPHGPGSPSGRRDERSTHHVEGDWWAAPVPKADAPTPGFEVGAASQDAEATAPTPEPPGTTARTGPGSTQPNPTPAQHRQANPGASASPQPGETEANRDPEPGPLPAPAPTSAADPRPPAVPDHRPDSTRGPSFHPAPGPTPASVPRPTAAPDSAPDPTSAPGPAAAPDPHPLRTATRVDLPTLPPAPVGFVGSGPPTYDAEPTALPPADPDELDDLVADTVLDGARYGACTLRAVSVRGDSARFRGEPRRDSLLTARFGTGEQALVLVAMATGARATPGAHRAAAEACQWIARAVGRSHARLAQDIGAARRGDLKSGLHRLTDRSLGKLRASAAEQGIDPEEYAATLRCLLLPADPDCRVRVFFGVGDGGLFRLRDGEWHDIEPLVTDVTGEPVVGFGSLPAETPDGDRLTMDLGIPTPPSPYEPAPEPPRAPFRFRASVARPGDTLLMCTGGLAEPLRGEPELCEYLTGRWSGPPPGLAAFLADSQVRVKGYADDRTAAAVWEA
ncbi:protein phosphatase 2C domain-containing protein [Streptomyces griseorubiginosus]|uniref:protein phosphatase 2C domain-containing protein n=1 Tax=Streptomyces griseorubiginosus TaxID=67304 RepID=UPI002E815FDA|nr:protein phosphatase 2C domain-containing protein [Streptomyces griseorubiginosus]WUB43441.1 protein phosphatase 2C domain-containing protein [Streptomyces griseorubiginosus]WUB51960.1 protein phosphatase 2C domain-containing protein [Streptomyces griseorubiginosus]